MKEERIALWTRLAALEAKRDKDWVKPGTRRRNAVATRKAETGLAGVHKELRGLARHCFGGRKVLRQGRLGQWRARLEPATCTDAANGALALDLNAEHLAATLVSGDGRLLDAWRWDLRADRDNVHSATRMLRLMAARRGVPVVAEDLDLRKKKAWLRQYRRRFAEVVSLFRSRQVINAVERQCRRRGVELIVVDPAWTTKLAKDGKYPHRYRIGLHHGAALVIARRGLGFAERVSKTDPPPVRADGKRRGTRGWESTLAQGLPRAWRKGGRHGANAKPGARESPVREVPSVPPRPDG